MKSDARKTAHRPGSKSLRFRVLLPVLCLPAGPLLPEAVTAFLEGNSFEDVIRTAVSLGGDCDTLTCIAGSMAEAFYGVPEELKEECRERITPEMREILERFDRVRK